MNIEDQEFKYIMIHELGLALFATWIITLLVLQI